jgi:hypothetical protein
MSGNNEQYVYEILKRDEEIRKLQEENTQLKVQGTKMVSKLKKFYKEK